MDSSQSGAVGGSFVSVLEVKMNYAVLNKSDEVKDGTLGLVPGTSRRPW